MAKFSRSKGGRGERDAKRFLQEHLGEMANDIIKTPGSGGHGIAGDISGLPCFHIEVKRRERILMMSWVEQAEEEAGENEVPIVMWRQNKQPWRITMKAEDFCLLVLMALKEEE